MLKALTILSPLIIDFFFKIPVGVVKGVQIMKFGVNLFFSEFIYPISPEKLQTSPLKMADFAYIDAHSEGTYHPSL